MLESCEQALIHKGISPTWELDFLQILPPQMILLCISWTFVSFVLSHPTEILDPPLWKYMCSWVSLDFSWSSPTEGSTLGVSTCVPGYSSVFHGSPPTEGSPPWCNYMCSLVSLNFSWFFPAEGSPLGVTQIFMVFPHWNLDPPLV